MNTKNPQGALPTKGQVIAELEKEIDGWRSSYQMRFGPDKGRILDPTALHTIRCLEAALLVVRENFPKRR